MNKPRLRVVDWRDKSFYSSVFDVVEIDRQVQNPSSLEGLAGVVFHNPDPHIKEVIKMAVRENKPVFLQGCLGECEVILRRRCKDYSNVYFIDSFAELFAKIREIYS